MPCFYPLEGYKAAPVHGGGWTANKFKSTGQALSVPCGSCVGCRLERSRQWGIRSVHEAKMHERNCFITMTYDPEHLPDDAGLVKDAFPKFIRRIRDRLRKEYKGREYDMPKVRYFYAGEYGTQNNRPHYHALLFGYDFDDKVPAGKRGEFDIYRSENLTGFWGKGHCEIGSVTMGSAIYIAKYILEKDFDGEQMATRYNGETGETFEVHKEFNGMSRRPGIGETWFRKWWRDVYPSDQVIMDGRPVPPPKYYDKLLEEMDPEMYERVKKKRVQGRNTQNDSYARRMVVQTCTKARLKLAAERKI